VAKLTRFALSGVLLLAVYYALFGGEYSFFELRRARSEIDVVRARLDSVSRVNDSLRAWTDSLETNLGTLERIAREQYGMIRDGEALYRFTRPDTAARDSAGGGA
jgi:cell division protein FtsB